MPKATGVCCKCGLPREPGKKCKPCETKRCAAKNKRLQAADPERFREYSRKSHRKHRDKRNAANKQWYLDHPGKQQEYDERKKVNHGKQLARYARYRSQNTDAINARKSARYATDADHHRALGKKTAKKRRARHRDRINAQLREWSRSPAGRMHARAYRRAHPHIARASNARRRALEAGATGKHTHRDRVQRSAVFGDVCWVCEMKRAEAMDHVFAFCNGGSNWPANLRPICNECNSRKAGWERTGRKPLAEIVAWKRRQRSGDRGLESVAA